MPSDIFGEFSIIGSLNWRERLKTRLMSRIPFSLRLRHRSTVFSWSRGGNWGRKGYLFLVHYRATAIEQGTSGCLVSRDITKRTVALFEYAEATGWDKWGIPNKYGFFFHELTFREIPDGSMPALSEMTKELFTTASPPISLELIGTVSEQARDYLWGQYAVYELCQKLEMRGIGISYKDT